MFTEEDRRDPKVREFVARLLPKSDGSPEGLQDRPVKDQPFVSPLTWAYYVAYAAICFHYYLSAKLIVIGVEGVNKATSDEHMKKIVKAALPHAAEQIDAWNATTFHHLLDPLEEYLLAELRRSLEDPAIDEERLRQSKAILTAVAEQERQGAVAKIAGANRGASARPA